MFCVLCHENRSANKQNSLYKIAALARWPVSFDHSGTPVTDFHFTLLIHPGLFGSLKIFYKKQTAGSRYHIGIGVFGHMTHGLLNYHLCGTHLQKVLVVMELVLVFASKQDHLDKGSGKQLQEHVLQGTSME